MKTSIALAALVLSLAACAAAPERATTTANPDDQRLKSAECLRSKGVKVSDPKGGQGSTVEMGGLDSKELEKALKECGALGGPGKQLSQADKDKALAFAKCMREQGLDFPDPDFSGGMQKARAMPKDKNVFEKANKICSEKTE